MVRPDKRPLDPTNSSTDHQAEGSAGGYGRDPKRPALASVIVEALKVDSLQKLCSSLEPILRRVVSEEVERALSRSLGTAACRSYPKPIQGLQDGRNLQLQFRSRLSLPLFTGGKVESEQSGTPIHVVLLDSNTGQIVSSGPESSAKLDTVVVEGDFNNEGDDEWSHDEFESHIVKEREGKRPLLSGDLQVVLKDGVGTLGEIAFTDNSSWIRSRKFRLGLKVASSGGCWDGIRIREAKTDAFTVKDHRGELYKKHYPPALNDEVWRLEKIGKDGSFHKRLNKAGIHRVEDFLRFVVRDAQGLRNILGSGMSNKMWDILVEHAKTCVLSGKLYIYYTDESKNIGVVFNNIYEFSGLIAGEDYYSADSISESQKAYVDTLVKKAYENWMHVIEYDGKSVSSDQNKNKLSSPPDIDAMISQDYSFNSSFDSPIALPSLPLIPMVDHGLDSHYNPTQIGTINHSFPTFMMGQVQESISHNIPLTVDNMINLVGSTSTQTLTPGFHTGVASNFGSYANISDLISDNDVIRMRNQEMLENNVNMQTLLGFLNTEHNSLGCQSSTGATTLDSRFLYTPSTYPGFNNHGLVDEEMKPSENSVVGWLKLKAALRWGIFFRKKAAERRAKLIELDDNNNNNNNNI